MYDIKIGDFVMCITHSDRPVGIVIKQYDPTSCREQTMIQCRDGRQFHAPTSEFIKISKSPRR